MWKRTALVTAVAAVFALAFSVSAGESGKKIVFISKGVHDFWTTVSGGVEKGAMENDLELTVLHPDRNDNAERQATVMFDAINTRPDAILLAPVEMDALVAPCKEAMDAGIPVILVDTGISSDDFIVGFSTNNENAGRMAADAMAKIINNKGKVHIISGLAAASSDSSRARGFSERMKEAYPGITVLGILYHEGNMAVAANQTVDIIMANPDIAGFYTINDISTMGCGNGLIQADRTDLILCGFDANDDLVSMLEEGVIDSLVVQQPFKMGYMGAQAAAKVLKGEKVRHETVDTGCSIVTKDNVSDPEVQKLLFPLKFL